MKLWFDLKEMHEKVIEILGEGVGRYTEISIFKNEIEIIADTEVTVEKLKELDEYFEEEGYIKARESLIYITYHLPRSAE